jgi:hypothetical protein
VGLERLVREAQRDVAVGPFDHRPADQAHVGRHRAPRGFGVDHPGLLGVGQLAPGGALAVEQRFPAQALDPARHVLVRHAALLEIVEAVRDAAVLEPGARPLDRVAVGDAVQHGLAHRASPSMLISHAGSGP